MTGTLVLPTWIANEIDGISRLSVETAGVLLANIVYTENGEIRILARKMRWVTESSYLRRGGDHLSISSEGYVPFLAEAETMGATAFWVHTHPGIDSQTIPSEHDHEVDRQITDLFRLRTGNDHYGAIIFSPRQKGIAFTGYIQRAGEARTAVTRIWEVGDRFRLTLSSDASAPSVNDMFDRNVRAFGGMVQQTLGDLRVGIVGAGGTGSAVAEQLVRLGVRRFVLFDPDRLSESNLTRVYGSFPEDVGLFKVDIVADHLSHIASEAISDTHKGMITTEKIARHLCSCDIVFGCTDDNAGRLVLSRFSSYLLTPVIDCGVLLSSEADGQILGIDGRVTTLAPGQACLICRDRIDLVRAGTELLTPDERKRREDEGYAPALRGIEPAVVAFTTIVAATAVSELLERLIGYGPSPRPSEVLLRYHDREISVNIAAPRSGHYCDESSNKLGLGLTNPFLEQTWPN